MDVALNAVFFAFKGKSANYAEDNSITEARDSRHDIRLHGFQGILMG